MKTYYDFEESVILDYNNTYSVRSDNIKWAVMDYVHGIGTTFDGDSKSVIKIQQCFKCGREFTISKSFLYCKECRGV